jgi:putative MATE family efflux protein
VLSRERTRQILGLALPIIGGMVSQNVLNLVDTAMVGTLGAAALAAVGMASFANFMASAFITGLSAGVQAIAARRLGEGKPAQTAGPLNGGLLLAIVLAVPLSILLIIATPYLFPLLVDDPEVIGHGIPYFRARLVAMVALGMNFAFRGFWNGINLSRLYLQTLLVMHTSNIFLNWVLIFGHLGVPALGSTGAGIGTAAATFIGTIYYIVLGLRHARPNGFLAGLPSRQTMLSMLRLSIPAGLQQLFFAAGMTAFFWIIGRVGTAELAASNVLVQLMLVVILPGIGFGLASASLVGQALGRGDAAEATTWGWDVCKVSALVVGLVTLPAIFFPDPFLKGFLHDPETLQLARLPLQMLAAVMAFDTVGIVLLNALLGAGYSRVVMVVSVTLQWGLFMPAAYLAGPVVGMLGIWVCQIIYRAIQTSIFIAIWRQGRWARVTV